MSTFSASFETPISRRDAVQQLCRSAVAVAMTGCATLGPEGKGGNGDGRLLTRPSAPTTTSFPGLRSLGIGNSRDGLIYVPTSYTPAVAAPLALLFHGAGQNAHEMVDPQRAFADETGLVLVAPDARGPSWDIVYGGYGPDTSFIDKALAMVFASTRIDATRVTVAGFSDGASYSLSIGRINGDLFRKVAAFSPGFIGSGTPVGKPKIFITHGKQDPVLPIDQTSRLLVPTLEHDGYDVEYHEFTGGHGITTDLLHQATVWLAAI